MAGSGSGYPALLDIAQAHHEQSSAEGGKDDHIEKKRHHVATMDGSVKHVGSIGQGKRIGKRFQKGRQSTDGKEQAAKEDHGETEKV